MALIGIYINYNRIEMDYHIHTAFLAIPIYYVGYFVKKYQYHLNKYNNLIGTIVAIGIVYYFASCGKGSIELSAEQIYSPVLFYPLTIAGIYACLGIARIIMKHDFSGKFIAYVGKNSFHIMVLHFFAFKVVDVIYGYMMGVQGSEVERFPYAFSFWYVYYIVGIALPLFVIWFFKTLKVYLNKLAERKKHENRRY